MIGEPLDREPPIEVRHQQPEHLRVMHITQQVHLLLLIASRLGQLPTHPARPSRPVRRVIVVEQFDAFVEKLVEQDRVTDKVVRSPAARREQTHHALKCGRKL
ncbi:MAG: hypothetical protein H6R02_1869, partial [Burkholderiaceae bacterium]|nr:hypothetical protein [Burkholderiaceae bacterium]